MQNVKLIWSSAGYKVEFCTWKGYFPSTDAFIIAHDLFEHTSKHTGQPEDEIKAIGAKLAITDTIIYDSFGIIFSDVKSYYKSYDTPERRLTLKRFKKGKQSIPRLARILTARNCGFDEKSNRQLLRDGFKHGEQFTLTAYDKVLETDF